MSVEYCPICGEGTLHEKLGKQKVEYHGKSEEIDSHFAVCDVCGVEQCDSEHLRRNKRKMIEFRKKVDGLLSGAEIAAIRNKLGLNKKQAAEVFGGGPIAFSKYESDDVAQSEAMDNLLRLASSLPEAFHMLLNKFSLPNMHSEDHVQENIKEQWVNIQLDRVVMPKAATSSMKIVKKNLGSGTPVWSELKRCA